MHHRFPIWLASLLAPPAAAFVPRMCSYCSLENGSVGRKFWSWHGPTKRIWVSLTVPLVTPFAIDFDLQPYWPIEPNVMHGFWRNCSGLIRLYRNFAVWPVKHQRRLAVKNAEQPLAPTFVLG
jgi:hypothetical protein